MSFMKITSLIAINLLTSALFGCATARVEAPVQQTLCDAPSLNNYRPHILLGAGYEAIEAGRLDCAERLLLQAQTLNPEDPYIALNLGVAYHKSLRFAQARTSYERAMQLDKVQAAALKEVSEASLDRNDSAGLTAGEIAQRNLALMR